MARGSAFIVLDMPEAAIVLGALRRELKSFDGRSARVAEIEGLKEALEQEEALLDRIALRFSKVGIKL